MSQTNPNGANRKCQKCGSIKSLSKHFPIRNDTGLYRGVCKQCEKKRKSSWYSSKKTDVRIQFVARKYGLSKEDYEILIAGHNGLCAICGKSEKSSRSLAIDHDHKTGNVRGMLCWMCNGMLGRASDDINILENAIKYLKKYDKKQP